MRPNKLIFLKFNKAAPVFVCTLLILLFPKTARTDETLTFSSQAGQVSLMELFVSEGCSSCPPAQKWVSELIDDPRLWNEIIPVVFHVDYWDYLGWKDPFASDAYTKRQYQYKVNGNINSVYTPGFVVNGMEWREWFNQGDFPINRTLSGQLTAQLESGNLKVSYENPPMDTILNIVILGFGIQVNVESGENHGRKLIEDFIVLAHNVFPSNDGQWTVPMPKYASHSAQRKAIALWISPKGDITPIQAAGGWLK